LCIGRLKAEDSLSRQGDPKGLRRLRRQTAGLPEPPRKPKGSEAAEQDKGRRRRAEGAGRAAQNKVGHFYGYGVVLPPDSDINHSCKINGA